MNPYSSVKSLVDAFVESAGGAVQRNLAFLKKRNRLRYQTFEIIDTDMIANVCDWYERRQEARAAVKEFLNTHVNRGFHHANMGYDVSDCVVDNDGRISMIAYTGGAGFTMPDGWVGKKEDLSTFMVPEDPIVQKALNQLPAIPTRAQLHEIIGWPTIEGGPDSAGDFFNHLIEAHSDGIHAYIDIPLAENFLKDRSLFDAARDWFESKIPEGLENMNHQYRPVFGLGF